MLHQIDHFCHSLILSLFEQKSKLTYDASTSTWFKVTYLLFIDSSNTRHDIVCNTQWIYATRGAVGCGNLCANFPPSMFMLHYHIFIIKILHDTVLSVEWVRCWCCFFASRQQQHWNSWRDIFFLPLLVCVLSALEKVSSFLISTSSYSRKKSCLHTLDKFFYALMIANFLSFLCTRSVCLTSLIVTFCANLIPSN